MAEEYSGYLADLDDVLTPTVVLPEVYKWVKRERSEEEALLVAGQLERTHLVPLNPKIELIAAGIGLEHCLAMADSIVYATAIIVEVDLVTSDRDFYSLAGVLYLSN